MNNMQAILLKQAQIALGGSAAAEKLEWRCYE